MLTDRLQGACDAIAFRVTTADENMNLFMQKASELESRRSAHAEQAETIAGKYECHALLYYIMSLYCMLF